MLKQLVFYKMSFSSVALTPDQEAFIEECSLEFSNRFTDADLEYKAVYSSEIPDPPIMCPWFERNRYNRDSNRERWGEGSSVNQHHRDLQRNNYKRNRGSDQQQNSYHDRRYQPY